MILKKATPWGRISGKLSLKPPQAMRMFGFKMDPSAKGVVVYKRKEKTIVRNLKVYGKTYNKKIISNRKVFGTISKLAHQIKNIIYDDWNPLTKNSPLSGFDLFIKVNIKRTKTNRRGKEKWKKMLLTTGTLPKPQIKRIRFVNSQYILYIKNPNKYQIGFVLLHSFSTHPGHRTLRPEGLPIINQIPPADYTSRQFIKITTLPKNPPVLFIYFKKKGSPKYSNSVSTILWKKCNPERYPTQKNELLLWQT